MQLLKARPNTYFAVFPMTSTRFFSAAVAMACLASKNSSAFVENDRILLQSLLFLLRIGIQLQKLSDKFGMQLKTLQKMPGMQLKDLVQE